MRTFKGILFALAVVSSFSLLYAEPKPTVAGRQMPNPGQYVSEAVYIASATCRAGADMIISSKSAILSHVNVTTVSVAGSIGVYDARLKGTGRMLSSTITTNAQMSWPFNVGASSGIVVQKVDGACVTFYYLETN